MSEMPFVEGVSHRWVEARGLRFHLAEAGGGEDVVLLLHGWPQHWYEWRHLLPALATAGHRAIAMDMRGCGWSDAPRSGYEKENLASDVLAVLDQLGLERVKLVGHDWGGWVGFLLCLREPRRFERYLALNIPPPWVELRQALPHVGRLLYQGIILAPGIGYLAHRRGRFVRLALRAGGTDRGFWDERTLAVFADNLAEPARARAAVQMYRVFNLRELPPLLRGRYDGQRLTVPTHLLFGADDAAIHPDLLVGCERHADDMQVELVPRCGHFIADERPQLVAERAVEFFST
jgi:pimeloyl-ACP methyl ester carboxylesterase